jgi:hypothetical protein
MIQMINHKYALALLKPSWSLLQKALDYANGEFSYDSVYNSVKARTMQLWLDIEGDTIKAAGLTKLVQYPEKRVCVLVAFSTVTPAKMQEYHSMLELWAGAKGIKDFEFLGRKGFERYGKQFGYKLQYVVMTKHIEE